MFFISNRTTAQFYNDSKVSFLVRTDHIDIIFKVKRGTYLTANVYTLSDNRLLIACCWENFFGRLKSMKNRNEVLLKLEKSCPRCAKIFKIESKYRLIKIDEKSVVYHIATEISVTATQNLSDLILPEVISNAVDLMMYNLDVHVELTDNSPFSVWKTDLLKLTNLK